MRSSGSNMSDASTTKTAAVAEAARLLWNISPGHRPGVLVRALACFPEISLSASFASGPLRSSLSSAWEQATGNALPIEFLRRVIATAGDGAMVDFIRRLATAQTRVQLEADLQIILTSLIRMQVAQCHDGEF